jgi:hypothetical protein
MIDLIMEAVRASETSVAGPSGRTVRGVGLDHLAAETVGSNPAYGMDDCSRLFIIIILRKSRKINYKKSVYFNEATWSYIPEGCLSSLLLHGSLFGWNSLSRKFFYCVVGVEINIYTEILKRSIV